MPAQTLNYTAAVGELIDQDAAAIIGTGFTFDPTAGDLELVYEEIRINRGVELSYEQSGVVYQRMKELEDLGSLRRPEQEAEYKTLSYGLARDDFTLTGLDTGQRIKGNIVGALVTGKFYPEGTVYPSDIERLEESAKKNLSIEPDAASLGERANNLFNRQCALFLLYEAHDKTYRDRRTSSGEFFVNHKLLKIKKPDLITNFTNISRNSPPDMHLFYLKNHVYSALVPDIQLYKVNKEYNPSTHQYELKPGGIVPIEMPRSINDQSVVDWEEMINADPKLPDVMFSGKHLLANRSGQIGIKAFNWRYIGKDRFTAERDIEAELTLVMDSLDALFLERNSTLNPGKKFRVSDLIIQPSCYKDPKEQAPEEPGDPPHFSDPTSVGAAYNWHPECFEIMVDAGFSIDDTVLNAMREKDDDTSLSTLILGDTVEGTDDDGNPTSDFVPDPDLKIDRTTLFKRMRSTLHLTLTDHNFNIKENGSVELTINYRGRGQAALRGTNQSIVLDATQKNILRSYEDSLRGIKNSPNKEEQIKGLTNSINTLLGKARKDFLSGVVKKLLDLHQIYILPLGADSVAAFQEYSEEFTVSALKDFIDKAQGDLSHGQPEAGAAQEIGLAHQKTLLRPRPPLMTMQEYIDNPDAFKSIEANQVATDVANIPYFYFGDLVDAIITFAGPTFFDDYRIIFDDISLPDLTFGTTFNPEKKIPISLAAVPISVELYIKFITELTTSRKVNTLSLPAFLKESLNKLIVEALGIQCMENALQTGNLVSKIVDVAHFSDPSKPDTDPFSQEGFVFVNLQRVLKNVVSSAKKILEENRGAKIDSTHLLILEVEDKDLIIESIGDTKRDFERSIPHFSIGQSYGLIKRVQLQKTDQPFLPEARMEQAGGTNVLTQLSNVYDATFEMIGNDLNTLGGLIYFDPGSLSPLGALGVPQSKDSLSYLMGLGGVHLITMISHDMSPGKYSTTVKARFISRGEAKDPSGGS
jgi:hypothetical protein